MPHEQSAFVRSARECFDFLIHEFGFTFTPQERSVGESVRYDNPTLYVAVSLYKGEIDVIFWVKVDTAIIRPASPRLFHLQEILRHLVNDPFHDAPQVPAWSRAPEHDRALLEYYAKLVRKHCRPILEGELSVLERLSKQRGG